MVNLLLLTMHLKGVLSHQLPTKCLKGCSQGIITPGAYCFKNVLPNTLMPTLIIMAEKAKQAIQFIQVAYN